MADISPKPTVLLSEADIARVTLAGEMAYMARMPQVRLGPARVSLPPGSFLQATPQAEAAMTSFVAPPASSSATTRPTIR